MRTKKTCGQMLSVLNIIFTGYILYFADSKNNLLDNDITIGGAMISLFGSNDITIGGAMISLLGGAMISLLGSNDITIGEQ